MVVAIAIVFVALREKLTVICINMKLATKNGDEMGYNSTPTGSRVSFYRSALGSAAQTGSRVSFDGTQRGRSPTATARMLLRQLLCIRGMKMNLEVRQTNSNKMKSHSES